MRRALWLVVLGAIAVGVAWSLAGLSGRVSVEFGAYAVEMATPLAIVALVVLVAALILLLRLVGSIVGLPAAWRRRQARTRRAGGEAAITRALVALAAGEIGDASRETGRARRLLGDTPQTLLLAAEAGRLAGREADAEAIFHLLSARDDAAFLGLRGLFRQAMAREDWQAAAEIAARAEATHPGAAWLREERTALAVRTGNWAQALALAGPQAPRLAYAAAAADASTDLSEATRIARDAWKRDPGFTPAALAYARRLREAGREARVMETMREAWKAAPQPDLAAFVLAPVKEPEARHRLATRLVQGALAHPESQFLLAQTVLDLGLTDEARRHAEAARAAGMNQRRLWQLIARIEPGDTEASLAAQREAWRNAAQAEADPTWRCGQCGTEHADWLPACPACHTPGRITWGTPARLALTAG